MASLESLILLPPLPECGDPRCVVPWPAASDLSPIYDPEPTLSLSIFLMSLPPSKLLLPHSPGTVRIGRDSVRHLTTKLSRVTVSPHGDAFSSYAFWYPSDLVKAVSVPSQTTLLSSGCLDTSSKPFPLSFLPFPSLLYPVPSLHDVLHSHVWFSRVTVGVGQKAHEVSVEER